MRRTDRIYFKCPTCGTGVRAPFEFAGKRATCGSCHSKIPVPPLPAETAPYPVPLPLDVPAELVPSDLPLSDAELSVDELPPPPPDTCKPAAPRDRGTVRVARYDADDDEDDAPRSGGKPYLWVWVVCAGFVVAALATLGVALIVLL